MSVLKPGVSALAPEQRKNGSKRRSVDILGQLVVESPPDYRPGKVITVDIVMKYLRVSRTMAREVLQALHQKRMVDLKARVGATIRPIDEWDVLDPDVVEWRLQVAPRFQMRSLTELREAIEPRAAFRAAERASADVCRDLVALSRELLRLGRDPLFEQDDELGQSHRKRYQNVDVEFHHTLLRGSQNEMFCAMATPVELALKFRIEEDSVVVRGAENEAINEQGAGILKRFPRQPAEEALWLHVGLAHAIQQGLPHTSEIYAQSIMAELRHGTLPLHLRAGLAESLLQLDQESGWGNCFTIDAVRSTSGVGSDEKEPRWVQFKRAMEGLAKAPATSAAPE